MATRQRQAKRPATKYTVAAPDVVTHDGAVTQEEIARRAYELYQRRGREHGHDWGGLVRRGTRTAPPAVSS